MEDKRDDHLPHVSIHSLPRRLMSRMPWRRPWRCQTREGESESGVPVGSLVASTEQKVWRASGWHPTRLQCGDRTIEARQAKKPYSIGYRVGSKRKDEVFSDIKLSHRVAGSGETVCIRARPWGPNHPSVRTGLSLSNVRPRSVEGLSVCLSVYLLNIRWSRTSCSKGCCWWWWWWSANS